MTEVKRPWLASLCNTLIGRRAADALVRSRRATLHGAHRVPGQGGALLVGNQGFFGTNSPILASLLLLETGRMPFFLADPNLSRIPGMRSVLDAVGSIGGCADDARDLLEAGQLLVVYPGGVDDAFKLSRDAYSLPWKERADFARIAMRARVPLIPVAATGVDELFDVRFRERWIGRSLFGSESYDLPLPRRILPRTIPLDFHVLPPIDTSADPEDPDAVERVRKAAYDGISEVLQEYRRQKPEG